MTDTTKWCIGALPGGAPAHQEHENNLKALAANALRESERAPATQDEEASGAPDQRCNGACGASGAGGAPGVEVGPYASVNILEVLLIAWAAGLVLYRRDDLIVVCGIKPHAPAELLQMLRDHKTELLAMIPKHRST